MFVRLYQLAIHTRNLASISICLGIYFVHFCVGLNKLVVEVVIRLYQLIVYLRQIGIRSNVADNNIFASSFAIFIHYRHSHRAIIAVYSVRPCFDMGISVRSKTADCLFNCSIHLVYVNRIRTIFACQHIGDCLPTGVQAIAAYINSIANLKTLVSERAAAKIKTAAVDNSTACIYLGNIKLVIQIQAVIANLQVLFVFLKLYRNLILFAIDFNAITCAVGGVSCAYGVNSLSVCSLCFLYLNISTRLNLSLSCCDTFLHLPYVHCVSISLACCHIGDSLVVSV